MDSADAAELAAEEESKLRRRQREMAAATAVAEAAAGYCHEVSHDCDVLAANILTAIAHGDLLP